MKDFIIRKLVKTPGNIRDPKTRESCGKAAGIVGLVSNLILCIFKIGAGTAFGSLAVLADGINNLSDASSSLVTLIGFKLAGQKPDKEHPYGHGRIEYLAGLAVSVMILLIGCSLLKESVEKILHPQAVEFSLLSVVVLAAAIAVKLWQASFYKSMGRLISSETLTAAAADSRNDVMSTTAVLVSVVIGHYAGINLDGPMGFVVAVFIIYSGLGLVRDTLEPIIGKAPDEQLVEELEKTVLAGEGILGVHDLIIHDYGPGRTFASCHAEVNGYGNLFQLHASVDRIESEILEKFHVLMTIHMDPVDVNDREVISVKKAILDFVHRTDGLYNAHDVRIVHAQGHADVVFDVVRDHNCKYTNEEIEKMLRDELVRLDPGYKAVIHIDDRLV